jgi:2'-5' RNA ligase
VAVHRLFVALDLPDPVRRRAAAAVAALRQGAGPAASGLRWTSPDAFHLTLQFLGAVPGERLEAVQGAVREAAAAARPLALELRGAGGFPNARRPRVAWLGIAGETAPLAALVAELGRRLGPLGFPPEARAWSPHLTVGRARDHGGAPGLAGAFAESAGAPGIPWRAAELVLYESHLDPGGARHVALLRAPLGGEGRA